MSACRVRLPSGSLRVHSGGVGKAPGSRSHRKGVWLVVEAVKGAAVGLSFGRLIKVDVGLFPLAGGGQSIDDGRLRRGLRDSEMGGPTGYVSGLVFHHAPSPMVKIC